MTFSSMGITERNAAIAAVVVVVTAIISLAFAWGALMFVSLLAGAGAMLVLFQPQVAPKMSLPGSKGSLLTALGVVAAAATLLTALYWSGYITSYLVSFDTLQFLVGLVAAVVLAWSGWQILRAEGGKFRLAMATQTPVASAPPAAPMAETPMAETPMAETPMAETPMAETPMAETPMAETPPTEEPPRATPG